MSFQDKNEPNKGAEDPFRHNKHSEVESYTANGLIAVNNQGPSKYDYSMSFNGYYWPDNVVQTNEQKTTNLLKDKRS